MGLDATVRCRCFEEGKLKPGPVPYDDLYIDVDGNLASKKLDLKRAAMDRRRFDAQEHGGVYRIIRHVPEEYDEYGDMRSSDYHEFVDERNHRVGIEPFGGKDISLLDRCYGERNGAIRGVMFEPYASRLRITTLPDA